MTKVRRASSSVLTQPATTTHEAPRRSSSWRHASASASRPATTLRLARWHFRACWLALFAMHAISITVLAGTIAVTQFLQIDDVGAILAFLGDSTSYFLKHVVIVSSVLLAGHLVGVLEMLFFSVYYRQLLFGAPAHASSSRTNQVGPSPSSLQRHFDLPQQRRYAISNTWVWRDVFSRATKHFGRHGSLGIEGSHYDTVYYAIESVSVAVRTFQAYRISTWIPRVWISRGFALLAILSCFSIPVVKLLVVEPPLKQRVALLVLDLTFDFVTSMVIPTAIVVPYVLEYDMALLDFPFVDYYHDTWFVQAVSENRQTFAMSWLDLFAKNYPRFSCLFAIALVKTCLSQAASGGAVQPQRPSVALTTRASAAGSVYKHQAAAAPAVAASIVGAVPPPPTRASASFMSGPRLESIAAMRSLLATTWRQRSVSKAYWAHNGFFIATGVALLAIQTYSLAVVLRSNHNVCLLEMQPWFATTPQCAVYEIHCAHTLMSDGDMGDLDALFADVQSDAVQGLIFSSCPRLQMPTSIAHFTNLQMIKIYNCTIDSWDGAATLTAVRHPHIQLVYIVNSNMTGVPRGLLADDFPPMLTDIEFSGTNLTSLPDEVAVKWAGMYYFVLERSPGVVEFPAVLMQLNILFLSLGSNSITRISDDAFTNQTLWELFISYNPLEALPTQIGDISKLYNLHLRSTLVAELPPWMTTDGVSAATDAAPLQTVRVEAAGSQLCAGAGASAMLKDSARVSPLFDVHCAESTNLGSTCLYPLEAEMKWRAHE